MRIALGCDHGGVKLISEIKKHLEKKNIEFYDFGTFDEEICDYPNYAIKVAEQIAEKKYDFGILVCGTGIGMSIAANKVHGIRAALCGDVFSAHSCREHNNANILALGARVVGIGLALEIVDTFLNASFQGDIHERRINRICEIEKKY